MFWDVPFSACDETQCVGYDFRLYLMHNISKSVYDLVFLSFWKTRIAGMLIELQTLLVNRSILRKTKLLADDIDQWASVLSQSNPGNGKRIKISKS